jgi:PAS domain S-box-containing protein
MPVVRERSAASQKIGLQRSAAIAVFAVCKRMAWLKKIRIREKWWAMALRYALAPLMVGLALLIAQPLEKVLPQTAEYVFILAVAACGWLGKRGPGLVSAALALYVFDYFFLPPVYTLGIDAAARPYAFPFLLVAAAAAWMSATRRAAVEAKEDLKENEEKFRRILTNLPDISWTVDQDRRLLYVSPKIEGLLGYSIDEIRKGELNPMLQMIHPDDSERVARAFTKLFSAQQPYNVEFRLQRKDGAWVWVNNRAVRTHLKNGIVYADGILTDVTERKEAELELRSKTALLEAQIDSTIDGILVVDPNGHRVLQNQRFIDMFRLPPETLAPGTEDAAVEHVLRMMKNRDSFLAKIDYLTSHPEEKSRDEIEFLDGTILDRYSAPVRDQQGRYYGRIWTFRDITLRRRNEDMLRQLSTVVEQSPVAVVITDPKGQISYVNGKFTESTGYSLEEVLGKNPRILNSGYAPLEMYAGLWQTVLSGKEWRGEFRNRKKNGEMFWESAVISPIVDENGKITHLVGMKQDITEQRAMESELRQAQKLEGIGQLAAGIAHEINTPTQFVTDNLTFLQDASKAVSEMIGLYRKATGGKFAEASPAVAESLRKAERDVDLDFYCEEVPRAIAQSLDGARRVANIVRAMKEFSHPDLVEKIDTDLNKAVESTITVARSEWKYVAEMETHFDASLPPVFCNRGEVNQVILNLVVNAAHSIRDKVKDSEKGRITISTERRGAFAEIAISDTGTGIPEAIQTRIYEPFFTTKEVGKGTGQGLALAHAVVVKKHQGKIWFETRMGTGTTFFVQLPIKHAAAQREP